MIDIGYMIDKVPVILAAVPRTLAIAAAAMAIGLVCGLVIAVIRLYRVPLLSQLAVVYISLTRGIPLLVQMYLMFYGLPRLFAGLNAASGTAWLPTEFNPYVTAILIFSLYTSAYQAETWYAALNSIDYRQMDAALSIGMTAPQGLARIVIPQAVANAVPNFGNLFIGLVKGTSLTFAIQIVDIMAVAKIQAGADYRYIEMYLAVSLVYWVINALLERLFVRIERRFSKYKRLITA